MIVDKMLRSLRGLVAIGVVAVLAGCAAEGAPGGDPGARPMPPGMSCQTVRDELSSLDARGAASKVEAVSAGHKVSDRDRQLADRYNTLLNYYLGGRCHT